jgi:hypothetical protein
MRYGGNAQLNWLEAERHLEQIVGDGSCESMQALDPAEPRCAGPGSHINGRFPAGVGKMEEGWTSEPCQLRVRRSNRHAPSRRAG